MRPTSFAFASFVVLIFCCVAICQESKTPPEHEIAKAPADLQSLIKTLSGKWTLRVRFEPSSEMPKGFDGEGEETWRSGPGGITLLEEERLPVPTGNMYLLGLIWSDQKAKSLRGMECDNQHAYTCDVKGALTDITLSWDGKRFVIDEQETHGSKKFLWHEVWSDINETSFTQTGDMQEADGHTTRLLTIRGTKSAGTP